MIITQSCDLARTDEARLFVAVCPVVVATADQGADIERGRQPRRHLVPWNTGLLQEGEVWVADFSLITTLERSVLVGAEDLGHPDERQRRNLADDLGRFFARAALPDEVNDYLKPLTDHASKKHGKDSPQGRALSAVSQIRVKSNPDFDVSPPWHLHLYFVVDEGWLADSEPAPSTPGVTLSSDPLTALDELVNTHSLDPSVADSGALWRQAIQQWLEKLTATDDVRDQVSFEVTTSLTPAQYQDSDELDLRHLSRVNID